MVVTKLGPSSWRDALDGATAGVLAPHGYALKRRESLGRPDLDRIFLERCREAVARLNRTVGQGVVAVVSPDCAAVRSRAPRRRLRGGRSLPAFVDPRAQPRRGTHSTRPAHRLRAYRKPVAGSSLDQSADLSRRRAAGPI